MHLFISSLLITQVCACGLDNGFAHLLMFLIADSQDQQVPHLACVRIEFKANTIPDKSTIEKSGQRLLAFLVGFLPDCPPLGKICESVNCATSSSVYLIISLPAEPHRRLLQYWKLQDKAKIVRSFCSSPSFCPESETSIVSISGKLGSTEWPFPKHRRTDTGTKSYNIGRLMYFCMCN